MMRLRVAGVVGVWCMIAQTAGAEMTITLAEQSMYSRDVAQKLAESVTPLPSRDERSDKQASLPSGSSPDLAKINSSSETHVAAFDDAVRDIQALEEQFGRLAESLAAVRQKVAHLKKMVHERLLDSCQQVKHLKDQARYVDPSMSSAFSTTSDQCEVSEGKI